MNPIRLMRYHDRELSPAAARRVERSLEADPGLEAELESYRALAELVRDWAEHRSRAHDDIADDVMRALEGRSHSARVPRKRPSRALAWASLAVGLAAGVALVVHALLPASSRDKAALVAPRFGVPEAVPRDERGPARSVAIESVDFGARGGTVFMVSTTSSDTPVVWTDDDESTADDERNEAL